MVFPARNGRDCAPRIPYGNIGSFDGLVAFLREHGVPEREVWMKTIRTERAAGGLILRQHGIYLSACLLDLPAAPVVYATVLAGVSEHIGPGAALRFPDLVSFSSRSDVQEALDESIEQLSRLIVTSLRSELPSLHIREDAQWYAPEPWASLCKGFSWRQGTWVRQTSQEDDAAL